MVVCAQNKSNTAIFTNLITACYGLAPERAILITYGRFESNDFQAPVNRQQQIPADIQAWLRAGKAEVDKRRISARLHKKVIFKLALHTVVANVHAAVNVLIGNRTVV